MRKDLDYGLLHAMDAFVHVVDAGSFTAAAQHLGLTKAQISRLVSALENRLQTKLLQRTTRRIAVTSVGERYVEQCKAVLDMVSQAEGEAAGTAVQPSGRLRVTSITGFGNRYVAPLVFDYCSTYPSVTMEYSAVQNAPDLLAEGIDVSIYAARHLPDSGMVAMKLEKMFTVLCASPEYLVRHSAPEHPRDLASHQCLRLVSDSFGSLVWELNCATEQFAIEPQGSLISDGAEVLLDCALRGLGIAMLPAYTVVDDLRRGSLVQVLPKWRSPEISIFALLPSRRFIDAKTRAWVELLKRELPAAVARDSAFFAESAF